MVNMIVRVSAVVIPRHMSLPESLKAPDFVCRGARHTPDDAHRSTGVMRTDPLHRHHSVHHCHHNTQHRYIITTACTTATITRTSVHHHSVHHWHHNTHHR